MILLCPLAIIRGNAGANCASSSRTASFAPLASRSALASSAMATSSSTAKDPDPCRFKPQRSCDRVHILHMLLCRSLASSPRPGTITNCRACLACAPRPPSSQPHRARRRVIPARPASFSIPRAGAPSSSAASFCDFEALFIRPQPPKSSAACFHSRSKLSVPGLQVIQTHPSHAQTSCQHRPRRIARGMWRIFVLHLLSHHQTAPCSSILLKAFQPFRLPVALSNLLFASRPRAPARHGGRRTYPTSTTARRRRHGP